MHFRGQRCYFMRAELSWSDCHVPRGSFFAAFPKLKRLLPPSPPLPQPERLSAARVFPLLHLKQASSCEIIHGKGREDPEQRVLLAEGEGRAQRRAAPCTGPALPSPVLPHSFRCHLPGSGWNRHSRSPKFSHPREKNLQAAR